MGTKTINQLKALRKNAHPELNDDGIHPADQSYLDQLNETVKKGKSITLPLLAKGGPVKKENKNWKYESWQDSQLKKVTGPKRTRDYWNTNEPSYKDWEADNNKWKKWLADNLAQSMTKIHWDKDGGWRNQWNEKVKPEDALKEQQEIQRVYDNIYTPDMELQDKRAAEAVKNKKKNKIPIGSHRDDLRILVESSKGDPYETAQWRKIFQEEYDKGRDVEPQYMKFVTKKEEPKKVVNDLLTVTWPEETETNNELQDREKQLNELILKAAMEKIHEATSGIGKFQFDRMRANSGGPADKPPTLEDYLRLGLSLAILTDDERRVVQELWKNTMETKNEK